jgi:ribosomal protein S1
MNYSPKNYKIMNKNKNVANAEKLITFADFADDVFAGFNNDKERIKYMKTSAYKDMNLIDSFNLFYNMNLPSTTCNNRTINNVVLLEVGHIYAGNVIEFTDRYISFSFPGAKNEIICKENFQDCRQEIQNYLLRHNNKLYFEVREFTEGKYVVSVLNAYYRKWMDDINASINSDSTTTIDVHIDDLIINTYGKGGYLCHCVIDTLKKLTGKNYTSSVFIPGSQIVLNIERDFKRWLGKDVSIIPQKFVDFVDTNNYNKYNNVVEKSLVGSRKRVLQLMGNQYLYDIYNIHKLGEQNMGKFDKPSYSGTVTGVINSGKKTGVFVELNDKYITGLLTLSSDELLDYRPGDSVIVKVKEFEVQPEKEPFIIKNGKVVNCHTRLIFELG